MVEKDLNQAFFDEYGELNALGRSLFVDAFHLKRLDQIPTPIYNHVLDHPDVTRAIFELVEMTTSVDYPKATVLISKAQETPALSDIKIADQSDDRYDSLLDNQLNDLLAQIKAEAIEIPLYEKILLEQPAFRNSASAQLEVIAPKHEALCIEKISFQIKSSESVSHLPMILVLENHQGKVYKTLLPAGTTEHEIALRPIEQFPQGLYYWKVALKGQKPILGKVYIKNSL